MRWHDVVVRSLANGRGLDIPCMRAGTTYLLPDCRQKSATARWQSEVWRRSDGTDFRRARLSLNRDQKRSEQSRSRRPPKTTDRGRANTDNSCFPSESTFCALHHFGDLCDGRSSLRVRFE